MTGLIRAELLKLRTTRTTWASVAVALAFVPLSVALAITSDTEVQSGEGVRNAMAAASSGGLILLVLGILHMAGEFRHGMATATFLVSPDRRRVVGAKLVAASLAGVAVAVATSALTLAIALPWLSAEGVDLSAHRGDIALGLLGALIATTLAPVVGVGLGAAVRNQTAAVTLALVWTQVVETLAIGFAPGLGRWLPSGAANAVAGVATGERMLPMGGAALLLAGYALAFAAAGTAVLTRRDVA